MQYYMCVLKTGEIIEGLLKEETSENLTIDGFRHHVEENKADAFEIEDASLTSDGQLTDRKILVISKNDILYSGSLGKKVKDQAIVPTYVPDDDAWMGKGFYNSKTGCRLLKVRQGIKPFSGCLVEVLAAEVLNNMPIATVRVYKNDKFLEGMQYKVDEELEDYHP